MKRRRFCCALAAAGVAGVAVAAEAGPALLKEVRRRLAPEPVVRGTFEQKKTVKGFRQPLLSSGEFLVSRQRGVVWRTLAPFGSTLVVTRDRLLARQADGSRVRILDAGQEPAVRAVAETLSGAMATDLDVLVERFRIEGELAGVEGWRLVLVPRDPALARWLQRVDIEGDRFLRRIALYEGSGDHTLIRLDRHVAVQGLRTEEEAQFE